MVTFSSATFDGTDVIDPTRDPGRQEVINPPLRQGQTTTLPINTSDPWVIIDPTTHAIVTNKFTDTSPIVLRIDGLASNTPAERKASKSEARRKKLRDKRLR